MSRYRWLHAEWPISIRLLAKRIKAKTFAEDSTHGFVIDRIRDDFLEARYVERLEYIDTVLDPFGHEISYNRVEFRQSYFRASTDFPGLELLDPSRSVQNLLNRLSEVADFEVAINPISLDVLVWAARFQSTASIDSEVYSMQIGSLEIETGILAKVIIKGNRDVRAACAALTQERKFALEKVQLRLSGSHRGTIVLTNSGVAKIDVDDPTEKLVPALRFSLAQAVKLV